MQNTENITLGKKVTYKDQYDPSILFPINREERRHNYTKMYGADVWTCFEVSYLLQSGLPQFMVLRIVNPADSVNIFESKSLKLYLNSFNNTKFDSKKQVIETIKKDLDALTGGNVTVVEMKTFTQKEPVPTQLLENQVKLSDQEFTYNYDPTLLKAVEVSEPVNDFFVSNLLRSNCEITNQPDWARIQICYQGKKQIDKESLLRYIVSYRKHQEFHEPTCERIYQDLFKILEPETLTVQCNYTRRGGIDINPIRSSNPLSDLHVTDEQLAQLIEKTLQQ